MVEQSAERGVVSQDDLVIRQSPHIMIHCDECRTDFYGELSRWSRVYTGGEDWHETCPNCRRQYWAILRFKKRAKAKALIPGGSVIVDGY